MADKGLKERLRRFRTSLSLGNTICPDEIFQILKERQKKGLYPNEISEDAALELLEFETRGKESSLELDENLITTLEDNLMLLTYLLVKEQYVTVGKEIENNSKLWPTLKVSSEIENKEEIEKAKKKIKRSERSVRTRRKDAELATNGLIKEKFTKKGGYLLMTNTSVLGYCMYVHEKNGGHAGVNGTRKEATFRNYYIKGLSNVSKDVVDNCDICKRNRGKETKLIQTLNQIQMTKKPWSHIAIDLIDCGISAFGNRYCLTVVCNLSRFLIVKPIPSKHLYNVSWNLFQIFAEHGLPDILQNDNGSEFVNAVAEKLYDDWDIENNKSAPYHPQSNGKNERHNGVIKTYLKKHTTGSPSEIGHDWEVHVYNFMNMHNNKYNNQLKSTPKLRCNANCNVPFGKSTLQISNSTIQTWSQNCVSSYSFANTCLVV
eukprot:TRINITY_DN319_c0_g1_i20.p1 TRINITY_DN319_c0_g1~~TRINITY_DN319_c0_g1_i20.p1  ORF type:complete len:432 (-),score=48.03 TRINITY_DN319_c0_g1_i20:95-1390(-)